MIDQSGAEDVVEMVSNKAFDKIPHNMLLQPTKLHMNHGKLDPKFSFVIEGRM